MSEFNLSHFQENVRNVVIQKTTFELNEPQSRAEAKVYRSAFYLSSYYTFKPQLLKPGR